jgi:hypothetical protein
MSAAELGTLPGALDEPLPNGSFLWDELNGQYSA